MWPENPAPHITDWLFDAGPTGPDGNGLGWRDIEAWSNGIGIALEPWEGRLIKRLSAEYGAMRHKAEKEDCPAPYGGKTLEVDVEDKVSASFGAMFKSLVRYQEP